MVLARRQVFISSCPPTSKTGCSAQPPLRSHRLWRPFSSCSFTNPLILPSPFSPSLLHVDHLSSTLVDPSFPRQHGEAAKTQWSSRQNTTSKWKLNWTFWLSLNEFTRTAARICRAGLRTFGIGKEMLLLLSISWLAESDRRWQILRIHWEEPRHDSQGDLYQHPLCLLWLATYSPLEKIGWLRLVPCKHTGMCFA